MTTLDPQRMTQKARYKLATGAVVPRPIAWVSTMDGAGRLNLAPFSFFNVAATNPLTLLFCVQVVEDGAKKDTLANIEARGEFVVNLPDERTVEAMNLSATALPPGQSEFEWAGVTAAPSERIAVPRVAEALLPIGVGRGDDRDAVLVDLANAAGIAQTIGDEAHHVSP